VSRLGDDDDQPVDLDRARRALAELRRLVEEHPELRQRTAAFLAGDPTAEELAELQAAEPAATARVELDLPREVLRRATALVPQADPPELATVLRLAVLHGLAVLEERGER
jgi:hypothetical protein